jgi:hypothetical protein
MQYLLTSGKVNSKEEALYLTSHHADIIPYSIGKFVVQMNYDLVQF